MEPDDPELDRLRADLDKAYGEGRWRTWRGVEGENGRYLYAWLMPPTSPQVLLQGRTRSVVEYRVAEFYRVLASPDPQQEREGITAARQAREAAESLDVSGLETGGTP